MIKSELVLRIAEQNPHLYNKDVKKVVNAIFDEIEAALARGDRVELRGFGIFTVKTWSARPGRIKNRSQSQRPGDPSSVISDEQRDARAA